MNTFGRYVLTSFLWQFLLMLFGFTALLQLFDLLNNSTDILRDHLGKISAVFMYATLRLPEIISFIVPFAVLMGALITLAKMERNNEIMAYKAAGAPYFTLLWAFLPAVGVIALFHFFVADRIVPLSIQALIQQEVSAERTKSKSDVKTESVFVQEGNSVIEAGTVSQNGSVLTDIRIYVRDDNGKVVKQIFADYARYDATNELWRLTSVWTTIVPEGSPAQADHSEAWDWKTNLTPAEFSDLVERPQAMTLGKIWGFISSTQVGVRPTYFYETWLQKRIALPVSSILMILLAAPVAHSLHRRERGLAMGMTFGFSLGFLYFITDGLVLSLGESGAVPPFLAAWLPILLFAAIGGTWLIKQEGY